MENVYIGVIVVLVLVVLYVMTTASPATAGYDRNSVAESVKSVYELQYETPAEALNVTDLNGLYRISVRFTDYTGKPSVQDVFVTKDGKLLTTQLLILDNYKAALTLQKNFVECLNTKGLRILGQSNDTATLQQLNLLGNYAYKVFVSCDGANEQICKNLGVRRYPTTIYNNTAYENIYQPDFFAQLTNCTLQ
jgi:hypothetical protein